MTAPVYETRRPWFAPIFVEVWQQYGEGVDWRRGAYVRWRRRGVFFRRRTADAFVRWLEERGTA